MIIYKATNEINGKSYIGCTKFSLEERKYRHEFLAKSGNIKNHAFYEDMMEIGFDKFTWEVIDEADNMQEGIEKETYWIRFCNSFNYGYNRNQGGAGLKGVKHTEEAKKKMRLKKQGEKCYNSKLTEEDVFNIRKMLDTTDLRQWQIAEIFNVTQVNISFINRGLSWSHLLEDQEEAS
ncbi:GIY-YIG nuclease family protein [Paenisporosarcina sp. NPDC076898]|uniref:GIY-YIG nuclease family protein n=1 Tax=unclassified Paenisporosarcina TaxID=2642018 RepID=UPI003CFD3B12